MHHKANRPKIQHRPSPPYHDLYTRPQPRPPDVSNSIDNWKDLLETDLDRNVDIEENSPFQEGIISETYERPDKSYVQEPYELKDLIDTTKLVQKFLPKQMDIDKILDIIKRKVLKCTHLPLTIREIQAGYLSSPYFKDLYLLLYNILLLINCYIGNSTTICHSRSMSDNRELTETFHQNISSHYKVIASAF